MRRHRQKITGHLKNPEGVCMAEILFYFENERLPSREEARDFYKLVTDGHEVSIEPQYREAVESYFGREESRKSPFGTRKMIERRIGGRAGVQTEISRRFEGSEFEQTIFERLSEQQDYEAQTPDVRTVRDYEAYQIKPDAPIKITARMSLVEITRTFGNSYALDSDETTILKEVREGRAHVRLVSASEMEEERAKLKSRSA